MITEKHIEKIQKICNYTLLDIYINRHGTLSIYCLDAYYAGSYLKIILNCNLVILDLISSRNKYKIILGLNLL